MEGKKEVWDRGSKCERKCDVQRRLPLKMLVAYSDSEDEEGNDITAEDSSSSPRSTPTANQLASGKERWRRRLFQQRWSTDEVKFSQAKQMREHGCAGTSKLARCAA